MGSWRSQRIADVLGRRARPEPFDAFRLAYALAPRSVRTWRARRLVGELPWLTSRAQLARKAAVANEIGGEPFGWAASVRWRAKTRSVTAADWSLGLLASDADVYLSHPLQDAGFVSALADAKGPSGFGDRTAVLREVVGDLLPAGLVERPTKAWFTGTFWAEPSKQFAASWDRSGVDPALVDLDRLHEEWLSPAPHAGTGMLIQLAWLRSSA